MDDHAKLPLLIARVASLEQQVIGDRALIDQLRQQLAMATRAEEILRRAGGGEETGPLPVVPKPRPHRRPRARDVTYLRVVKVATILALGVLVVAGAVIPASSLVAGPAAAGTSFTGMEQDHVDAAEAGLCHGQLPEVGEWPGSDALVSAGRSPFGMVAFGGDADAAIADGWCG